MTRADFFFGDNFSFNQTLFDQVRCLVSPPNNPSLNLLSSSTSAIDLVTVSTTTPLLQSFDSSASKSQLPPTLSSHSSLLASSLHTQNPPSQSTSSSTGGAQRGSSIWNLPFPSSETANTLPTSIAQHSPATPKESISSLQPTLSSQVGIATAR